QQARRARVQHRVDVVPEQRLEDAPGTDALRNQLVYVTLPFDLRLDWALDQVTRRVRLHVKAAPSFEAAMLAVRDHYGLARMRELAIQSANGSLTDGDRSFLDAEFQSLSDELDRISGSTDFNGRKLLQGSASAGITFQVGPNNTSNDRITVSIANAQTSRLGTGGTKINTQTISTVTKSQNSLGIIDAAVAQISTVRATLGATQNRLTVTIDNLGTSVENLAASNARIRDADIAKETAVLTKNQILVQAGVSVLAQANSAPQVALSLLG
ncbi:MAG TPA: hypothetical protein EYP98_08500, partial [Planctomycetes bacterium]|nr:hypothetical protein [Planctomycetota bacterium]